MANSLAPIGKYAERVGGVMHFSQLRWCGASMFVALLARVTPLVAQGATVTGHVTNVGGQPLAGVTVSITGMGLGATTRDDGLYTFTVPAGRVTGQVVNLNARRVGYSPQNVAITLNALPTLSETTTEYAAPSVTCTFVIVTDALVWSGNGLLFRNH